MVATGQDLPEEFRRFADVGLHATLGVQVDEVSEERVRLHLDCDERHHQPYGLVHGGVYATLVESAASMGAGFRALADGRVVVGVNNQTDFLRSHRTGRLDAEATPVHVGRLQQLWRVVVSRADDGATVAIGQVRLQNLDPDRVRG